jgi:hypothetical protein
MLGKGGTLCAQARTGQLRCPLIVRPTSEDVITSHLVQALSCINPRWWLPDLLNAALGAPRFRRQYFRNFKIRPWQNQPCYPRELLPWEEGSTQIDVVITWENPPTTVFIEAKYLSGLSARVSGDDGESGFPSDQLVRNIRVGLHRCGYFGADGRLFDQQPRDFVMVVLAPTAGHPLVAGYRDPGTLLSAIPHANKLMGFPGPPFVGELGYREVREVLRSQSRWMTRAERRIVEDLCDYLEFKQTSNPGRVPSAGLSLPSDDLVACPEPQPTQSAG